MAPRPDPFQALVSTAEEDAPLSMGIDLERASPTSVLTSSLQQAIVLVDPMSTGVILQQKVFETGMYNVVIVWSDRSQPAAREKHFKNSGHPREDFLAVITHQAGELEDTLLAILAATTNMVVAAVMCGSEFGVLLEDEIANGLNQKLGTTHLRGSGIPILNTKVDKHLQADTIRDSGLNAVREKLALCEDDVQAFLDENNERGASFMVKPHTDAGSVGVTLCHTKRTIGETNFHHRNLQPTLTTTVHKTELSMNTMTCDTNTTETLLSPRPSVEGSQGDRLDLSQRPSQASTTPPTGVKRFEKRVSIDLIPMGLEEIEWAMGDCQVQEEEREIQEIRERLQRRKEFAAALHSD